jgi:hypothetical protein
MYDRGQRTSVLPSGRSSSFGYGVEGDYSRPEVPLREIAFDLTRYRPTQFWANDGQTGSYPHGAAKS